MRAALFLLLAHCSAASVVDVVAGVYSGASEIHESQRDARRKLAHRACVGGNHWSGVWMPCVSERPMTPAEIREEEINERNH